MSGGPWGDATPFIVAVYGLTAVSLGALIVWSLVELARWKKRAKELETQKD